MRGALFTLFIILGLFMFAKQAPKFIMDALGIKGKGSFAKALGLAGTALGLGGAVATGVRAGRLADEANGKSRNTLRDIKNVGAGLLSGLATTGAAGEAVLNADKDHMRAGMDVLNRRNAQTLTRGERGSTAFGRARASIMGLTTGQTPADKVHKRQEELDRVEKSIKDFKTTIESRFDGNEDYIMEYDGNQFNWLNFDKNVKAADSGDESSLQWLINHGFSKEESTEEEFMEEYNDTETVGTGIIGVDGREIMKNVTVKKSRPVTRTVTKTVVDLDRVRAEYEKIHKEGYKQFTHDVVQQTGAVGSEDGVAYGSYTQLKADTRGVVVDTYDKYGQLDTTQGPIDLSTVDFSDYSTGVKATIGHISGTKRDFNNDVKTQSILAAEDKPKTK